MDASRPGINHGEIIKVRSRRGEVQVKAKVTQEVPQGMVWMAFHFREGCANWLTNAVFDPVSQTAELQGLCGANRENLKLRELTRSALSRNGDDLFFPKWRDTKL